MAIELSFHHNPATSIEPVGCDDADLLATESGLLHTPGLFSHADGDNIVNVSFGRGSSAILYLQFALLP